MTEGIGSALKCSMLVSLIQTEGAAKSTATFSKGTALIRCAGIGHPMAFRVLIPLQWGIRDDTDLHPPRLL